MTNQEIFARYAAERATLAPPGFRGEVLQGLVRLTPVAPDLDGVVMFAALSEAAADCAIAEQCAYFDALGRAFEWKVYALDRPADLAARLEVRGFKRGETEAFMVYPVDGYAEAARGEDAAVRIERVATDAGIGDVVAVQETVWGRTFPWLREALQKSIEETETVIYCAYEGAVPVGSGWIEFPGNSTFAELHGGAVLPRLRGRGVYSALFQRRVVDARQRGCAFIAVDAAPMSRRILLRKGFRLWDPLESTCRHASLSIL